MEAANVRFMDCEEDIRYVKCATRYDIVKHICNSLYDNGWKTSFDYLRYQPKTFTNKKILPPKGTYREFIKYVDYCYLLSRKFTDKDDAAKYRDKQGISIYFSVVLYWLLVYFGVTNEKKLAYCQGYFRYKIRADLYPESRFRAGMHAWLNFSNSVIDTTIWQQEDYFDFKKAGFGIPAILGEIPEGLGLVGFEEDRSIVKEYARYFAKNAGMTFYQWLNQHKEQADLLFEARTMEKDEQAEAKRPKKKKSLTKSG